LPLAESLLASKNASNLAVADHPDFGKRCEECPVGGDCMDALGRRGGGLALWLIQMVQGRGRAWLGSFRRIWSRRRVWGWHCALQGKR
jgi:hypothetical protein